MLLLLLLLPFLQDQQQGRQQDINSSSSSTACLQTLRPFLPIATSVCSSALPRSQQRPAGAASCWVKGHAAA
jgi:hypothetical protein